jgi:oxalyl-CoA decarboxylase
LTDGFHLVVDALKANDIDTSYGVVGIPITDLARVAQASGIRYIGFRQETSAGNAAAAAGFLTRRPGVCLTVSRARFPQRSGRAGERHNELLSDDPDLESSNHAVVDLQRGDYASPTSSTPQGLP